MDDIITIYNSPKDRYSTLFDNLRSIQQKEDEKKQVCHEELFAKKVWKVQDLANFLECSIGHVYNLSSRDLIPKKKKGKFLFFNPREILEWIYEGE